MQLGLNGKNLDLIYSGHKPTDYGLALRKWNWGIDGLSYEKILPSKSLTDRRKCATKDSMLKFFREFMNYFSQSLETCLILRFNVFFCAQGCSLGKNLFEHKLLGSIERKFPSSSFPNPKEQAKKAANTAGLNAKQRIEGMGKYSEQAKELKKAKNVKKNAGN